MKTSISIILIFICFKAVNSMNRFNNSIYSIIIGRPDFINGNAKQTAFKIKGKDYFVTSLHGFLANPINFDKNDTQPFIQHIYDMMGKKLTYPPNEAPQVIAYSRELDICIFEFNHNLINKIEDGIELIAMDKIKSLLSEENYKSNFICFLRDNTKMSNQKVSNSNYAINYSLLDRQAKKLFYESMLFKNSFDINYPEYYEDYFKALQTPSLHAIVMAFESNLDKGSSGSPILFPKDDKSKDFFTVGLIGQIVSATTQELKLEYIKNQQYTGVILSKETFENIIKNNKGKESDIYKLNERISNQYKNTIFQNKRLLELFLKVYPNGLHLSFNSKIINRKAKTTKYIIGDDTITHYKGYRSSIFQVFGGTIFFPNIRNLNNIIDNYIYTSDTKEIEPLMHSILTSDDSVLTDSLGYNKGNWLKSNQFRRNFIKKRYDKSQRNKDLMRLIFLYSQARKTTNTPLEKRKSLQRLNEYYYKYYLPNLETKHLTTQDIRLMRSGFNYEYYNNLFSNEVKRYLSSKEETDTLTVFKTVNCSDLRTQISKAIENNRCLELVNIYNEIKNSCLEDTLEYYNFYSECLVNSMNKDSNTTVVNISQDTLPREKYVDEMMNLFIRSFKQNLLKASIYNSFSMDINVDSFYITKNGASFSLRYGSNNTGNYSIEKSSIPLSSYKFEGTKEIASIIVKTNDEYNKIFNNFGRRFELDSLIITGSADNTPYRARRLNYLYEFGNIDSYVVQNNLGSESLFKELLVGTSDQKNIGLAYLRGYYLKYLLIDVMKQSFSYKIIGELNKRQGGQYRSIKARFSFKVVAVN